MPAKKIISGILSILIREVGAVIVIPKTIHTKNMPRK